MEAELQAVAIEIDEEDAPYLDLRDDRERQGYTILKNQNFVHRSLRSGTPHQNRYVRRLR